MCTPLGGPRLRLVLAGLVALLAASCGEPEPRRNVILISIDTLRADHLGAYGYPHEVSPHLDAFAREALVFDQAVAPAPWTLPSHAAMLTGRHPREIGFLDDDAMVPAEVPMLAESFAAAGYRTAAFVDSSESGYVGAARGFGRGFESYRHAPLASGGELRYDFGATVDHALAWLRERRAAEPFFLFLHTKSVHAVPAKDPCRHPSCPPYDQPAPWRFALLAGWQPRFSWVDPLLGTGQDYLWGLNREIFARRLEPAAVERSRLDELVRLYDAGIRYTDAQLGGFLAELDRQGLAANTIVVVTADHGEAFLEHDFVVHQQLFEPLVRVPLLLRVPGREPARIADAAPLEALAATLLRLSRVELPRRAAEAPMAAPLPIVEDGVSRADSPLFSTYEVPSKFAYRAASVRRGAWKLIEHTPREGEAGITLLFDLRADPHETHAVSDRPELAAELHALLRAWLARPPESAATLPSGKAEDRALRALPYID